MARWTSKRPMRQRGKLREVLLQEQRGYVCFLDCDECCGLSGIMRVSWRDVSLRLSTNMFDLIVGHLLCGRGWHCICLFTSVSWFDCSVQSVGSFSLLVPFCMLRSELFYPNETVRRSDEQTGSIIFREHWQSFTSSPNPRFPSLSNPLSSGGSRCEHID